MVRWQLHQAIKVMQRGGVIAYPTESVYGLGCDPTNLLALSNLLGIKNRPVSKGLILLVSDLDQATPYIKKLSSTQRQKITEHNIRSDRATTWLIPKADGLTPLLCGEFDKIAIRLTKHPVAKRLCQLLNSPLVSTSCNLTGKAELVEASQVRNHFIQKLGFVLSGQCAKQAPSQIIDLISGQILRQ